MISVLTWTYNWQEMFDITIPCLLAQEGVEFEIVAGCGPSITLPKDERIRRIDIEGKGKCAAYNRLIDEAKGDILFLTQADMQLGSKTQLQRMLGYLGPKIMVTERFWKYRQRDCGMYHQCMLIHKKEVVDAGKCDEAFDDPSMYAFEDTDLIARLLKNGMNFKIITTEGDDGVFHIDHPQVDLTCPIMQARINKGRALYNKKHDSESILSLYGKQVARRLMEKRLNA